MIAAGRALLEAIREHGRRSYPDECCGVLLGIAEDGAARVARVEPIANTAAQQRGRRYEIQPLEYERVERLAGEAGLAVLGFYHSHPDHPAVPSEYDRERALPFFHYVIVAVGAGSPGEIAAYVLSDDRSAFHREELRIEEGK